MLKPYNFSEWPWIPDGRQTVVLLSRKSIPRKIFDGLSDVDLGRLLARLFIALKLRPKKSSFDSVKKLGESHASKGLRRGAYIKLQEVLTSVIMNFLPWVEAPTS